MITLDQIAYNIKNLVEGGISGEDSNLSIRQIKHMVHYHRANLLTKYTDSGRYTSDVIFKNNQKHYLVLHKQYLSLLVGLTIGL